MKKQQLDCKILDHTEIIKNNFCLTLEWPNAINIFKPAQFIEIESSKNFDPLLRRPFSIFDADKNSIKLAYKKLGKGTTELSKRKVEEKINVIGPLGNFYPIHKIKASQKIVIVGGGTGIASVHYLAKHLEKLNMDYTLILGFRSVNDIFCALEMQDLKGEVIITTNDGSIGKKGFVTDHFIFETLENSIIFTCGPEPMVRAWHNKINEYNIKNYEMFASLEEYMGCGLGLCNGCVVKIKTKDGFEFKRVCKTGPVFNIKDIIWA